MSNKWYSEEMKSFHTIHKEAMYYVYHWFYTGNARDWNPKELKWGYVGVAPYPHLDERYRNESKECALGLRKRKRKVIEMYDLFKPKNKINFKIVGMNLTRKEALQIEQALRPEGYTTALDQRIWNEVAGG